MRLVPALVLVASTLVPSRSPADVPPAPAAGALVCHQEHASIHATLAPEGCESPVGLCFVGPLTGAGVLTGTIRGTVLTLVPITGARSSFTEHVVLTTKAGTIVFDSAGVFDAAKGRVVEMHEIVLGSGSLQGASGYLLDRTLVTPEFVASGELEGELCLPAGAP